MLSADYQEVSLRDDQEGQVDMHDLDLQAALVDEIVDWNSAYQSIIPASASERSSEPLVSLIDSLDQTGLELADLIAAAVKGGVKVRYYSEGRLEYLS